MDTKRRNLILSLHSFLKMLSRESGEPGEPFHVSRGTPISHFHAGLSPQVAPQKEHASNKTDIRCQEGIGNTWRFDEALRPECFYGRCVHQRLLLITMIRRHGMLVNPLNPSGWEEMMPCQRRALFLASLGTDLWGEMNGPINCAVNSHVKINHDEESIDSTRAVDHRRYEATEIGSRERRLLRSSFVLLSGVPTMPHVDMTAHSKERRTADGGLEDAHPGN
ncbi:hypothetical protein CEXT_282541 [Caerostris extrusa]|uniref:Uncharacterized protein n=1 Tax=Caerostris extrusa TaxID=172846 RepID=A0AAV4WI92_CAEEX|nr:hypothetical protein CEXT_282541 [Caerostris extrusa]